MSRRKTDGGLLPQFSGHQCISVDLTMTLPTAASLGFKSIANPLSYS